MSRSSSHGLITRQKSPINLESPFSLLDSFLTPNELFYIRNHFAVPQVDLSSYRLQIDGAVKNPLTLGYRELRDMASERQVATLECAGNSRVFLVPELPGAQWELGAVGNAEWTGIPLCSLLERAGLEDEACEIVLEGADKGEAKEKPKPPGKISYARSLAVKKALQPEVLIAFQMNGRDLSPEHGFPVRTIVPGHYGMASVKWLTHIRALRLPFHGYFQSSDYAFWHQLDGLHVRTPIREMLVKTEIAQPGIYESIPATGPYLIRGAAWSGEAPVSCVEVTTDAGGSWAHAEFIDPLQRHSWRRWRYEWETPRTPGKHVLMSRATDETGSVQPAKHDQNYHSYCIHHTLPIEVFVEP